MRLVPALVVVAVWALVTSGCTKPKPTPSPQAAKPAKVEWKVASAFSSTLPILGSAGTHLAQQIKELSGGRIDLQVFEPGKLVPPLGIFDAVSKGTVDAGLSQPNAWFDKMPAVAFFGSPPFGADTVEYLAWLYEGRGLELWRQIYGAHNVVPVPCGYLPPEASGWFLKPIKSPDDFKGLKIHIYGMGGLVLQKLGAQVLLLSAEDIYPALQKGVLDAAQVSVPSIDEKMGLAKVAKNYYFPGWHQQASVLDLLVNKGRWDALSAADRDLIDVVCRDTVMFNMTHGEVEQAQALSDLKKQGVQVHYWSPQMLQVFDNAYHVVEKEMRIKDADFKRVDDAYRQFRERYSEWNQLSRLPRGF